MVGERVIDKERILLGRKAGVDIRIKGESISKVHAQIVNVDGEFILQDLNSTNGTRVGDELIQWHYLKENDQIHIGGFVFEFHQEAKQNNKKPPISKPASEPVSQQVPVTANPLLERISKKAV
jgi:pSer/pThr/pTyr-binding forkhead associated (FHA) protein